MCVYACMNGWYGMRVCVCVSDVVCIVHVCVWKLVVWCACACVSVCLAAIFREKQMGSCI